MRSEMKVLILLPALLLAVSANSAERHQRRLPPDARELYFCVSRFVRHTCVVWCVDSVNNAVLGLFIAPLEDDVTIWPPNIIMIRSIVRWCLKCGV